MGETRHFINYTTNKTNLTDFTPSPPQRGPPLSMHAKTEVVRLKNEIMQQIRGRHKFTLIIPRCKIIRHALLLRRTRYVLALILLFVNV